MTSIPSQKILVVDDTEATRYAVARTLKTHGFEIIEAANGTDALALALSEQPDLITLDIHLPDILGFEVCRRLKKNPLTAHIPVLQVSASFVTSKDRIHGLEGGADSYLTHPFEPPVLIATVKALLRARSLTEELRLSEERFRVALKNAPILIFTCDRDLRFTWMYNPPAPLTPEHFIGKRDQDVFTKADAQKFTELKTRSLLTGIGSQTSLQLRLNGEDRHYDITVEPMLGAAGKILGLTVACIDITARMKAENAQKRAAEEARLADQAKSRFVSNMSHEIRTPLGVIQGFADLALDDEITAAERNQYLHTIKRNAANLTKLLGEILDLSKIEAGRIEIEQARFSMTDLVKEVIEALSLQAHDKGISLNFSMNGPFPNLINSDPTRLRQILMNIISNALKFTARGEVNVVGRALPPAEPFGKTRIEFDVIDTGIGLTQEQTARLFQAFTQADSSTTRKFGGTGLGLSLSKKLAEALGGDLVLVRSEIHRGSHFKLTIDAGFVSPDQFRDELEATKIPDITAPKFSGELSGMRVLLVEDSLDNQMLFSRYLQQSGAILEVASDGLEGLKMARESKYDVILMDIQMPNLDGYGATLSLRADGIDVPIIALTAHALKEERQRALHLGFNDYLIKPLDARLLIRTLQNLRTRGF